MTHAERMRISYVDWRILIHGSIRRSHIMETFGVSESQASIDINEFRRLYPDALRYDLTAKQYVPANGRYRSVTGWTQRRAEAWAAAHVAGIEWAWG